MTCSTPLEERSKNEISPFTRNESISIYITCTLATMHPVNTSLLVSTVWWLWASAVMFPVLENITTLCDISYFTSHIIFSSHSLLGWTSFTEYFWLHYESFRALFVCRHTIWHSTTPHIYFFIFIRPSCIDCTGKRSFFMYLNVVHVLRSVKMTIKKGNGSMLDSKFTWFFCRLFSHASRCSEEYDLSFTSVVSPASSCVSAFF